jgi:hypothetical protein
MSNLVNKKVTLGTTECPQLMGNASAFGYQCNRAMSQASTANREGNTVRFEHGSSFVIDICEVVIYSNPSKCIILPVICARYCSFFFFN